MFVRAGTSKPCDERVQLADGIARVGLDAKVVLRDARWRWTWRVNPDFSQVESDQPQVAVNQRFELFYPEKRPFFLRARVGSSSTVRTAPTRSDNAQRPGDAVFSATRPESASSACASPARVDRGRSGVLVADDRGWASPRDDVRADDRRRPRCSASFGPVNPGCLRHVARAGQRRQPRRPRSDLRWKLSPNWVFAGQAVASRSKGAERDRAAGPAYNASLFYSSRAVSTACSTAIRSPTVPHDARASCRESTSAQMEQYARIPLASQRR